MKRTALVVATVAILIGLIYWANRKWPGAGGGSPKAASVLPPAPNVTFKDLEGKEIPLSQFKGKVVLVNFWATWCEPCRIEIPWLINIQKKYAPRGFTILGVAMDVEGKSVVEPFALKHEFDVDGHKEIMNYPIMLGNDPLAEQFGGLIGMPTSILISRDGKKVKTVVGMILNQEELDKDIEALLK
jgi:thiol-disulfide isomerase/thioredoxin